jgi:Zn-dependent peptidase ImmA (M78 family)
MKTIGSCDLFAIEYEFQPDPDNGKAALPEESLSWGRFAIWVKGLNICQSSCNNKTEDYVSWYLYPLLSWFVRNWEPLLYEEQPPIPTEKTVARTIFFEYAKQAFGFMSDEDGNAWYNWGQRHSLRSCSNGGIFPDLFIRASGDSIEFSWGNTEIPGMPPDMFFTAPYGSQDIERSKVKEVLSAFLIEAAGYLANKRPKSQKLQELNCFAKRTTDYDIHQQLKWMIPALRDGLVSIDVFLEKVKFFFERSGENYISAPILMFGSFSPRIQEQDIDAIINHIYVCNGDHPLQDFVKHSPIPKKNQHESGYGLSLDFIDNFSEHYKIDAAIENILEKLDIKILRETFSDNDMRGIAMAGMGLAPSIFVNVAHPNNMDERGIRFTLAHELCHLLFDRQYGQEVGISSGPWAPPGVEKRANAFAAMLLMPPDIIEKKFRGISDISNFEQVKILANDLQVSATALIEHFHNIGAINVLERNKLREENMDNH